MRLIPNHVFLRLVEKTIIRENYVMTVDRCPADLEETVEAYLSGRLPEEQRVVFEDHFLGCPRCSDSLQFTDDFIKAVRRAAGRLRGAGAAARA